MESQIIFGTCNVQYDGRATSTLIDGKYLIIIKSDGSLIIHDSKMLKPKNYIGPRAKISMVGSQIIAECKKEKITINLLESECMNLAGWDNKSIELTRTEFELRDKLAENIEWYLGVVPVKVEKEFKTKYGVIDLLVVDDCEVTHIIEVKRDKASVSACSQLYRYYQNLGAARVMGYIASPRITDSALMFLEEYGLKFIPVSFEDVCSAGDF